MDKFFCGPTNRLLKIHTAFAIITSESFLIKQKENNIMAKLKLSSQISYYRKKMNLTQEELANAFGVTNQAVSKWESGICCPDIELLPDIADYFGITVDELMGISREKQTHDIKEIAAEIKELFTSSPENECFDIAFKLAALLHEGAISKGYRDNYIPWGKELLSSFENDDVYSRWGISISSEAEGGTAYVRNGIFFAEPKYWCSMSSNEMRDILSNLKSLADLNSLEVLFSIYELTRSNFDYYAGIEEICEKCRLSISEVQNAIENMDSLITSQDTGSGTGYRIVFMHIPPLVAMLLPKKYF